MTARIVKVELTMVLNKEEKAVVSNALLDTKERAINYHVMDVRQQHTKVILAATCVKIALMVTIKQRKIKACAMHAQWDGKKLEIC
jgi:hypothetical protein